MSNNSKEFAEKPPLGLRPEWVVKEQRVAEIKEAIDGYMDALKEIPQEWIEERYQLQKWLREWRASKSSKGVDFEILQKKFKKSGAISFLSSGRGYRLDEIDFDSEEIYAVRRLSDGVEFKVWDRVVADYSDGKVHTIESFYFEDGKLLVKAKERFAEYEGGVAILGAINHQKHFKKILFTTEDGVDLYDRADPVYQVLATGSWETRGLDVTNAPTGSNWWKSFSTKDKRDEYILMHKPLLSVSDVLNMPSGVFESQLKQLAKSKIK